MIRLLFDFSLPSHRKRYIVLIAAFVLLILSFQVGQYFYLQSIEQGWQQLQFEKEQARADDVQQSFAKYQNQIVDVARSISEDSVIKAALTNSSHSTQQCFERLQQLPLNSCTVELFDSSKTLFSWNGNEGIKTDILWLASDDTSFGVQGPIYSFLVVVISIREKTSPIGYVVAKRLFDVKYPISNRFINQNAFTATFSSQFEIDGTFNFEQARTSQKNENILGIPLHDIHGKKLGEAILPSFSLEESREDSNFIFQRIRDIAMLGMLFLMMLGISSVRKIRSRAMPSLVWNIACIWIVRYALVFIDFPASFITLDIFEPSLFASAFGFGIAKSIGDMFLSSLCLLWTIVLISNGLIRYFQWASKVSKISFSLSAAGFAMILPILLRGIAAVIHSSVFDSTLNYNDRMYIIPPLNLGMMLLSIFIIVLALVIAAVLGILLLQRMYGIAFQSRVKPFFSLLFVTGILIAGSLLVGYIHPNPLFTQLERIGYIAAFAVCVFFINANNIQQSIVTPRALMLVVLTSIVGLIYPLDKKVHEFDRSHVEFLASNIFRPADSYFSLITQQALRELSTNQLVHELNEQNPAVLKKLAFKAWAQSVLSRQGLNCSVSYVNQYGDPVSQFYLGANWEPTVMLRDSLSQAKGVTVEERALESSIVRIYRGYMPALDSGGAVLGGVTVEVSAGREALLEGETPEFLRNYPERELSTRHRTVVYSEYNNGNLTNSSSPTFHSGIRLPKTIVAGEQTESCWLDQEIDTINYETFFFPAQHQNGQSSWFALSMRKLSFSWYMYNVLRTILFLTLCSFIFGIGAATILYFRKKRIRVSFRTKLIIAFFIVSLIPTAILAYYNRQFAIDRLEQSVIEQLTGETTTIATALQRQWALLTPFDLANFTDLDAAHAADDFNIPFTLFNGAFEAASSTPELFRAELFDRRMTSDAYLHVVVYQKSFYSNVQSIGTLQYIVGYRPLLNDAGKVFAVVAVPTLFRMRELDREIIRRNVYLFGTFVFAMIIALLVGLFFSHQISSPVRRLHSATRKIGSGDFNVQIRSNRTDEIGELERSFDAMLTDLKRLEEEKMKTQRELAWKEMAKQVAHEIKNPLTPMKLSLQHLRQAYSDRVENFGSLLHQISSTILEQIEALNRIASEFAHFARMPERKIERCELHRLLRDVIELFGEHTGVTFNLQFCNNSPIILADKEELRRAFMNIIRNSVQAMNEMGTISIRSSIEKQNAIIMVTDSGSGIAPEIRDRLFEPNFSTKTDGMGMGLAIVKKTIDDLNGTISIESEPQKGTTVSVTLPIVLEF